MIYHKNLDSLHKPPYVEHSGDSRCRGVAQSSRSSAALPPRKWLGHHPGSVTAHQPKDDDFAAGQPMPEQTP